MENLNEDNELYTIEDGVLTFFDDFDREEIFIPKGVTRLGKRIFAGCKNITVYCGEYSKPEDWDADWDVTGGLLIKKRCRVIWGWRNK